MELLNMTESHVLAVARLEKLCFPDPWSEASVAGELENPLSLWLVAVENGEVVGYVGSQAVLNAADIMNVAVAPEHRRKGIARLLLLQLEEEMRQKDVCSLTLEVRVSNLPAQALYEELGYREVGRRPNYYRKPKEDALILRKEWVL